MGFAESLVPSFAYNPTFLDDNRSDERIRLHVAAAFFGQIEGADHPRFITIVHASTVPKEKR
jgi:hypothetical protein